MKLQFEFINDWIDTRQSVWNFWIHLLDCNIYKGNDTLCFEFVILGVGFEITLQGGRGDEGCNI